MNGVIEVNRQIRNLLLAGTLLLLLTACEPLEPGSESDLIGMATPANNPETTMVPNVVENHPTAVPAASADPERISGLIGKP